MSRAEATIRRGERVIECRQSGCRMAPERLGIQRAGQMGQVLGELQGAPERVGRWDRSCKGSEMSGVTRGRECQRLSPEGRAIVSG